MQDSPAGRVALGEFEVDLRSGDLHRIEAGGQVDRLLLREQPLQVLRMLVAGNGALVSREAIRKRLWPNDTIVNFDHSINVAIGILRQAFGDSAANPRYIETVARRGYRLRIAANPLPTAVEAHPLEEPIQRSLPEAAGLVGRRVSNYRVLEIIGGGGMGLVYKAEDLRLGRLVALKFLPPELAADPLALRRFEREAQSASALNHPNICTLFGIDEDEGVPFLSMELLEGESLLDRLDAAKDKRLPLTELLDVALQIAAGLQAAHDKGIIHRDIKPANIFLTRRGITKILDFGLAKLTAQEGPWNGSEPPPAADAAQGDVAADGELGPVFDHASQALTHMGTAIGTARYMSPEQIRKEPLDPRSDIFSFGLVLFEMTTGRAAFSGNTEAELHAAILGQPTPSARNDGPWVPRSLDAIILRALEKDPAQRYPSAAEMHSDLERVVREMSPRRRLIRKASVYAALCLFAAAVVWMYATYRTRVTLSPGDTIVLADVTNRTSDAMLDEALTLALHAALEQTPYLNLLGPDKVFGDLAQLRLPLDSRITPDIARRICLRSDSKMMISSSIADEGNRYQIDLAAVDCQSTKTLTHVRETVDRRDDIVHTLGIAAVKLRRKLGEPASSIKQYDQPLEIATSPYPEALRFLTEGYKHHIVRDVVAAANFYQRALEIDPNFSLAYSALGAAYQTMEQPTQAKEAEEKAFALKERLTAPGKFQVATGYYDLATGELDKSSALYARWVELFPHDLIARFNYAFCLTRLGRVEEAAKYARDAARDLPSSNIYENLMLNYIYANRLNEAKTAFNNAIAHSVDDPFLRDKRVLIAFLEHDDAALEEQWSWARQSPQHASVLLGETLILQYHGQFRAAHRSLVDTVQRMKNRSGEDRADDFARVAVADAFGGDVEAFRWSAEQSLTGRQNRISELCLALGYAMVGDTARAKALADFVNQEFPLDTLAQNYSLPSIRAAIQLQQHDPSGALKTLQPALRYDLANPQEFNSLDPAYLRGLAYLQLGDGPHASIEFQKLLDHQGMVGRDVLGAVVILQMARARKASGDIEGARTCYEQFLSIWKSADPENPIYRQARSELAALQRNHSAPVS